MNSEWMWWMLFKVWSILIDHILKKQTSHSLRVLYLLTEFNNINLLLISQILYCYSIQNTFSFMTVTVDCDSDSDTSDDQFYPSDFYDDDEVEDNK